jgi:ABC-type enterobactin transport system permease subunit
VISFRFVVALVLSTVVTASVVGPLAHVAIAARDQRRHGGVTLSASSDHRR